MHEPSPFAALLRRYRLAAELTQEGLAERTGLSTQAVGALERGHRKLPYRDTVRALADALDLDAAERLALEHALSQSRQPTVNANIAAPNPAAVPADPPLSQGISRPNFASDQLIGRAAAVAAVAVLLRSAETRLVTMTGPGGVGKTRLATEVARVVAGDFPDGATFVPLASVDDHRLVAATIANAIGARGYATARPEETLRAAIGAQRLLLILDNMEHVLAATPLIADLHAGCPHLTILVTSRAVLRVRGERVYEVPPLALPDANANPAALLDSAAVALFVRRAQEAFPGFALTESNAAAVAAICHRLDRLPLALELAAARLTLLSPAGLRSRLDRALPLLTGGGRDRPERQQTLRAALAWSYELLSPGEQAVFRRLAPFAGGCTVAAAEAVCGADQALAVEILDWLAALLEHGLLRRQPGEEEEPRFALLETVREYAAEQLAANGETASAQRRHAAYFLALAEAESPALTSTAPHQALARLEREHDNLRAALAWLLASPDGGERALRLTGALWRFWLMRGHATQGLDWLMRSLKASQAGGVSDIRARVMGGASALAHSQGDYARAAALGSASLGLWRELGDPEGIAGALGMLALSHHGQGDYAAAIPLAEEALGIWQAQGDQRRAAALLTNLGAIIHDLGDYPRAERYMAEGLALKRVLGDVQGVAIALHNLAECRHNQGAHESAAELLVEALAHFRELGVQPRIAHTLHSLGMIEFARGEIARSATLLQESLGLFLVIRERPGSIRCLEGLARVADSRGEQALAVRLLGCVAAQREEIGFTSAPVDRAPLDTVVARARSILGAPTFAAIWAAGRGLSLEAAAALVAPR